MISLFPPKISWDFSPNLCFPLEDLHLDVVFVEPFLGTGNEFKKVSVLGVGLQFGFAFLLFDPQLGVV